MVDSGGLGQGIAEAPLEETATNVRGTGPSKKLNKYGETRKDGRIVVFTDGACQGNQ